MAGSHRRTFSVRSFGPISRRGSFLMKSMWKAALTILVVAACGRDGAITEPVAPNAAPSAGGGILAIGVDSTTGATIETNKDDYSPGEVVHLVGRGWGAGETV